MPPPDAARLDLPLQEVPARKPIWRIHLRRFTPVFYGPGHGRAPSGRFDAPDGGFGVLYASLTFEGSFAETLLRNPERRMLSSVAVADRAASLLTPLRALRVVAMHGSGLSRLGLDNRISTGPYAVSRAWARALWQHPARPDGIAYHSRHDPAQICLALFEICQPDLSVTRTVRLDAMQTEVAAALDLYGKGFLPPDGPAEL